MLSRRKLGLHGWHDRWAGFVVAAGLLGALVLAQVAAADGSSPPQWDLRAQEGQVLIAQPGPDVDAVSASQTLAGTLSWNFEIDDFDVAVTNPKITVDSGYPVSAFTGGLGGASSFPVTVSQPNLSGGQSFQSNSFAQFGVTNIPTTVTPGFDSSRTVTPASVPAAGGDQQVTVSLTPQTPGLGYSVSVDDLPGTTSTFVSGPSNLDQGEVLTDTGQTGEGATVHLDSVQVAKTYVFTFDVHVPNPYGVPWTHKPFVFVQAGSNSSSCCSGPTNSIDFADPSLDGGTPGRGHVTYSVDQTVNNWEIFNGSFNEVQYDALDSPPTLPAPTLSASPTTVVGSGTPIGFSGTGIPGASISLLDGGNQVGGIAVDANGNWSTSRGFIVGSHTLTAIERLNNATSAASSPVTVQVEPPAPTIDGPGTITVASSPAGVTLTGNGFFGAAQSPPTGSTVTLFEGSSQIGTALVGQNGRWSTNVLLSFGSHALTATQTLAGETGPFSAPFTVHVLSTQTITFTSSPPSQPQVGGAYTVSASGGGSGEPVLFSIDGSSDGVCSLSGTTVGFQHVGICVVDANQAGTSGYLVAPQAQQTIKISKGDPQLSWSEPAQVSFGTPLGSAQLDATASVAGTFAYSPAAGAVLQPGAQTLTATFTPSDTADWNGASISTQLLVGFTQSCITGHWTGPLTVAAGQSVCIGPGATVTGPVTVKAGGALWVSGSRVTGPLSSTGALALTVCGSTLTGPLSAGSSTGSVLVGNPAVGCQGNNITGPVSLTGNSGGVAFAANTVTGPVTISNNTGGFAYNDNTITGPVKNSNNN